MRRKSSNIKIDTVSPKVAANRKNGQKGGLSTASRFTTEQRRAWGSKAGGETLKRYGRDYFKYIVNIRWRRHKKRKNKRKKENSK